MATSTSALPGTTITNLPISISLDGSETFPIVQGGTTKTATINELATFASSLNTNAAFILASSASVVYPNARQLAVQSGVLTLTDGGPSSNITIGVASSGINSSMIRQSTGLSVLGNPSTATAFVTDISGTANQVLTINSAGNLVDFGQVNLASSNAVINVLGTNFGGTGSSAFTPYQLIIGGSVSSAPFQSVTAGTSGYTLTYNSSVTAPSWQASRTLTQANSSNIAFYNSSNSVAGNILMNGSSAAFTLGSSVATGTLVLFSSGSGGTNTITPSFGSATFTLPSATTTLTGNNNTDTLSNKTINTANNTFQIGGTTVSTASDILNTLGSSQGMIIYRGATTWTALSIGSSAQVLAGGTIPQWTAAGAGTVTSVAAGTGIAASPSPITNTGTISLATISNNTVLGNVSGGTTAPTAITGAQVATLLTAPTRQIFTSGSGTYSITSTAVKYLVVKMVGGGGGGAGSGTSPGAATAGSNTTFAGGTLIAGGGGAATVSGGAGGAMTSTGVTLFFANGGAGGNGSGANSTPGGIGGTGFMGGNGPGGAAGGGAGVAAIANTGGGGGGAGVNTTVNGGGGGGSGAYLEVLITTPSSVYTYIVGGGGNGGTTGTGGAAGGNGGSGILSVYEFYQ